MVCLEGDNNFEWISAATWVERVKLTLHSPVSLKLTTELEKFAANAPLASGPAAVSGSGSAQRAGSAAAQQRTMQAVQAQGGAAITVAPVMSYQDFILTGDLCCVEALKISVGQIAAPALEYYEHTVEGEMGGQMRRMRLARAVFDPLHVKANGLSPGLIEDLFETYRSLVGLVIFLSLHSPNVPSCYCTHCALFASPPASVF